MRVYDIEVTIGEFEVLGETVELGHAILPTTRGRAWQDKAGGHGNVQHRNRNSGQERCRTYYVRTYYERKFGQAGSNCEKIMQLCSSASVGGLWDSVPRTGSQEISSPRFPVKGSPLAAVQNQASWDALAV